MKLNKNYQLKIISSSTGPPKRPSPPRAPFKKMFKLIFCLNFFQATKNVYLISLVSDTAACLLSGLYRDPSTRMSITIGDSLNLSYIEKYKNTTAFSGDGLHSRTALRAEIKNFGDDGYLDFIKTEFDYIVDSHSSNPGQCTYVFAKPAAEEGKNFLNF